MALSNKLSSKIRLSFMVGVDGEGKSIVRTKTYQNVSREATVDQIIDVVNMIKSLSHDPIQKIERIEHSEIYE